VSKVSCPFRRPGVIALIEQIQRQLITITLSKKPCPRKAEVATSLIAACYSILWQLREQGTRLSHC